MESTLHAIAAVAAALSNAAKRASRTIDILLGERLAVFWWRIRCNGCDDLEGWMGLYTEMNDD